jgi:hypothetical protein
MLTEIWWYVIVFNKIVIHKINKELYAVIFLFFYIIYSYSFAESVRRNCDKKEWKEFWSFSETHAVPYLSHISMKSTYLKYKISLLTWMVSRYLSINNFGFDYYQLM